MKIRCEKSSFFDAVSVVSRAVSGRSSLPILEGILLRAFDGGLELSGYDLDTGISTKIEAVVEKQGEIVLPARVLLDIARRLPGEFATIWVGEKCLTEIKSGAAEYTLLGMPAEEFPEFPSIGETADLSVPENALKSMIDQTLFAVSQSDSKPVHTGSLFEIGDDRMVLVSVDGYRLALRRERVKAQRSMRFVVPGRTLAEVSRILSETSENPAGMRISKKHIVFHIGAFQVFSRLLEGDFIDYNAAIPKQGELRVRVSNRALTDAVERVSLIISDRIKSPLRLRFEKGEIHLSCSTSLGRATDTVAADIQGDPLEMGFNSRYLLDALRNAQYDEVVLEMSGALSPMKVLPVTGDGFLFLVLPVRLKSEG
jgi:DNA polymerase-3 subunit beta